MEKSNISNIIASPGIGDYMAREVRILFLKNSNNDHFEREKNNNNKNNNDFRRMRKSQTLSLQDQRLKNKVHESCSSSLQVGDVQRQPVIGGVNWQIQYKSRACSLSSSTGKARSLN